jgi:hypothetical protein
MEWVPDVAPPRHDWREGEPMSDQKQLVVHELP